MKGTFDHTQGSALATWTITHNLDSDAVVVDVYVNDSPGPDYTKILPLNVIATDDNTVTVTFTGTHTGVARVAA